MPVTAISAKQLVIVKRWTVIFMYFQKGKKKAIILCRARVCIASASCDSAHKHSAIFYNIELNCGHFRDGELYIAVKTGIIR